MPTRTDDPSREQAMELWQEALRKEGWVNSVRREMVPTEQIRGRVSAEAVYARRSVPHYRAAAMDGIAVQSEDTKAACAENPVRLRSVSGIFQLQSGQACCVDTGDVIPARANAVIMREHVRIEEDAFCLEGPISAGRHVREVGEDIHAEKIVLPAGRILGPTDIAACLAAGVEELSVYARPYVTVIPSGDEIVDSSATLAPGQIRDVNSHMLKSLLESWGANVRRHPVVNDDYVQLCTALDAAVKVSDLVILNAGTSYGSGDFTAKALQELGTVLVHGVAIRPGRPVVLAVVSGKPVVGLPGYPASCLLTAQLFVHEILSSWQRKPGSIVIKVSAELAEDLSSQAGTEEFIRVLIRTKDGRCCAVPLPRGASLISSLVDADGWVRIPAVVECIHRGECVDVEFLRETYSGGAMS